MKISSEQEYRRGKKFQLRAVPAHVQLVTWC
jgi:hypothetical protein